MVDLMKLTYYTKYQMIDQDKKLTQLIFPSLKPKFFKSRNLADLSKKTIATYQ
jgi:hypothetical protein